MTSGHPADAMVAVVLLAAGFIPWLIGAVVLLLLIRVNAPQPTPAPASVEPEPAALETSA